MLTLIRVALLLSAALLQACTPQQALVAAMVPAGALTTALGRLEQVSESGLKRVAELTKKGDWQELASFADMNLAKDPVNADWWLIAGYARSQLREHAKAAEAYRRAISIEPDNTAAWHLLAQSYRAAGEPHRAVNVLNNALNARRNPPLTYYLLGESYGDLGRHADAAAAYRDAVKMEPRFAGGWFGLASAYRKLGRTAEAREAELQLEKLDPKLLQRLRDGS